MQDSTIIEVDHVEAPAETSPQAAQKAARRIDTDIPPGSKGVARLSPLMPPLALGLSCVAVIIAVYALWQTSVTPKVSSGPVFPDPALTTGPVVAELVGRVDQIDSELAEALVAFKADVTRLQDLIEATESTTVAPVLQTDLSARLEMRLAALESRVERALARLDNPPAHSSTAPNKPLSYGVDLLLASGLLADNLAGQPLTQWIDLLQQHSRAKGATTHLIALENAAAAKPEPIAILMRRAQKMQALLVAALNAAGDDAGFLQRVVARLGQLVQLRAASPGQAGNAGAVQAFERALIQQDFDGALTALRGWQGDLPDAVDKWRLKAEQRRALDKAVRATVASLLAKAMETN